MSRSKPKVITCMECCRPWGAVLPKDATIDEHTAGADLLIDAYRSWCEEVWRDDITEAVPCPTMTHPSPRRTEIVWVSEKTAAWLDGLGHEVGVETPCWLEVGDWAGIPDWWEQRRRRSAVKWDCCNLDDPRSSEQGELIESRGGLVGL